MFKFIRHKAVDSMIITLIQDGDIENVITGCMRLQYKKRGFLYIFWRAEPLEKRILWKGGNSLSE